MLLKQLFRLTHLTQLSTGVFQTKRETTIVKTVQFSTLSFESRFQWNFDHFFGEKEFPEREIKNYNNN